MFGDRLSCDAVELVKQLVDKAGGRLDLISNDKGRRDPDPPPLNWSILRYVF